MYFVSVIVEREYDLVFCFGFCYFIAKIEGLHRKLEIKTMKEGGFKGLMRMFEGYEAPFSVFFLSFLFLFFLFANVLCFE